jgi:hypothetical protein
VSLPATVADLNLPLVAEAFARHAGNVTDAAADLRVPPSDLRRLLWANPVCRMRRSRLLRAGLIWRRRTLRRL